MTVALVAVPVAVAVIPPGDEVTVYPLIWDPPLEAGAVQVTVACALPAGPGPAAGGPRGPPGTAPAGACAAGVITRPALVCSPEAGVVAVGQAPAPGAGSVTPSP